MPANLSIKNVPDDLHERLRQRAKANHRSLQGELLAILEEALDGSPSRTVTIDELYEYAESLELPSVSASAAIIRADRDAR